MTERRRCGDTTYCVGCRWGGPCPNMSPSGDALTGDGRLWKRGPDGVMRDITQRVADEARAGAEAIEAARQARLPVPIPGAGPVAPVPDAPAPTLTNAERGRLVAARIRQLRERRRETR